MSKLTFKEIKEKCVSGETELAMYGGGKAVFLSFFHATIVIFNYKTVSLERWSENNIRDWSIKQPEREIIELYLTEDTNGVLSTCDKDGRYPDYEHKEMNDTDVTMYRINRSKEVYRRIYADTFEGVEE